MPVSEPLTSYLSLLTYHGPYESAVANKARIRSMSGWYSARLFTYGPAWKTSDWSISDGSLVFTDTGVNGASAWTGDTNWGNYNLTVKCKAIEGAEGFGVYFGVKDSSNY